MAHYITKRRLQENVTNAILAFIGNERSSLVMPDKNSITRKKKKRLENSIAKAILSFVGNDELPPAVPDERAIKRKKGYWKKYAEKIIDIIALDDAAERERSLDEEAAEFEDESEEERESRCKDNDNWVWEDKVADGNGFNCCADDCWYQRNLDRRDEYAGSYRLIGTYGAYLCDVCFSNGANETPSKTLREEIFATLCKIE